MQVTKSDSFRIVSFLDPVKDYDRIKQIIDIHPNAIRDVTNPPDDLILYAIRKSPFAIQFCANPTMEMMLAAVGQSATSIMWINNPPVEIQELAVRKDPSIIMIMRRYISDDLIKEAISANPSSYFGLREPSESVTMHFIDACPDRVGQIPIKSLTPKIREYLHKKLRIKGKFNDVDI